MLERLPNTYKHKFLFIIDRSATSHSESPILVVDLHDDPCGGFRTVPTQVQSIENNLSIANMDFEEFAESVEQMQAVATVEADAESDGEAGEELATSVKGGDGSEGDDGDEGNQQDNEDFGHISSSLAPRTKWDFYCGRLQPGSPAFSGPKVLNDPSSGSPAVL